MKKLKISQKSNNFFEERVDFSDYNIPLSEMKNDAGQNNGNEDIDNSIDPEAEEIPENQYLTGKRSLI